MHPMWFLEEHSEESYHTYSALGLGFVLTSDRVGNGLKLIKKLLFSFPGENKPVVIFDRFLSIIFDIKIKAYLSQ